MSDLKEISDQDLAQIESKSWYAEDGTAVYSGVREQQCALRIRRLETQLQYSRDMLTQAGITHQKVTNEYQALIRVVQRIADIIHGQQRADMAELVQNKDGVWEKAS